MSSNNSGQGPTSTNSNSIFGLNTNKPTQGTSGGFNFASISSTNPTSNPLSSSSTTTPAFQFGQTTNASGSSSKGPAASTGFQLDSKPSSFPTTGGFGGNSNTAAGSGSGSTSIFGSSSTPLAFGATTTTNNNTKNTSSVFGALSNTNDTGNSASSAKSAAPNSLFGSNSASTSASASPAPAFSFGAKSTSNSTAPNTSMFGTSSSTPNSKPVLSFGATSGDSKAPAAFSFGNKSTDSTAKSTGGLFNTEKLTNTPTPSFSFGTSATALASKEPEKPANSGFPLGGASSSTNFSFGAPKSDTPATPATNETPTTPAATSSFSFGAKPTEKSEEKPASFSFGAKPTEKPEGFSLGGSAAKPATGGLFEKPTASGFSFGAKTDDKKDDKPAASGFSFGAKPEEKKDGKPATSGFSFGAKTDDKKDDKPASSGFSFGTKPEEKKDGKPAASGFSFGSKTDDKKDDKPASSGFSFGTKPEEKKDDKPAASGFSFGAKTDDKKDDKPAASGFSFGAKPEEKPASAGFSLGSKADDKKEVKPDTILASQNLKPTKIEPQQVSIENKTLDDLLSKWSLQLNETGDIFKGYTSRVQEWDQQLVQSGQDISNLYQDTLAAEELQNNIDQNLTFVESQQTELEKLLDNYEAQADTLLSKVESSNSNNSPRVDGFGATSNNASALSVTDKLREKAYHNAELLDEKLESLSKHMSHLIDEINGVSETFNKKLGSDPQNGAGVVQNDAESVNPIEEIMKLLNLHLENLKYIEVNENILKGKLEKLQAKKVAY